MDGDLGLRFQRVQKHVVSASNVDTDYVTIQNLMEVEMHVLGIMNKVSIVIWNLVNVRRFFTSQLKSFIKFKLG